MKDNTILKLKKKMEASSKAITTGDKAIRAIQLAQEKVIEDFKDTTIALVSKSEEIIAYHKDIIAQVKDLTL